MIVYPLDVGSGSRHHISDRVINMEVDIELVEMHKIELDHHLCP